MPFMMTVLLKHESAENSWNMLGKFFFLVMDYVAPLQMKK